MNKIAQLEKRIAYLEKVSSLEEFRKEAIKEFLKETWLKEWATEVLGREVLEVAIIGSVLDPKRFREDSDVDVAFSLKPMPGDNDRLREEITEYMRMKLMREPLFTTPDVGIFFGTINPLKGSKKKIV